MSYDLDVQFLDRLGRELHDVARAAPPARRRLRRAAIIGSLGLVVAVPAVAATTDGFDFGGDIPKAGEPGGPPPVATVPDQQTLDVLRMVGTAADVPRLRDAVEPYGLRVEVRGRPVADAAVGRVFGLQFPRDARFDVDNRLVVEPKMEGTIIVTVGQRSVHATTEGLTLYEVLPQVERAVDRSDPTGTGERLRAMGFSITWRLVIDNPARRDGAVAATGFKTVDEPPIDAEILSVLDRSGANRATENMRELVVEVAPSGSAVLGGHR